MAELIVLRLIHVVGGMYWVGSALFNFIFLAPAMSAAGPAAGPMMNVMKARKLFVVAPTIAILVILSGVRLMMLTAGDWGAYFASARGATYGAGAVAAVVAFGIGVSVALPAQKRMGMLGASMATLTDDGARAAAMAEMAALQKRLKVMGTVVTGLLIIAAVTMAIARYV